MSEVATMTTRTPSTPTEVLDSLWRLAQLACTDIESRHPDLLLVLYKSGWAPLHAVQTLWQATRNGSLPPILPINLGSEKGNLYLNLDWGFHSIEYTDTPDIGHLLAWSAKQTTWQRELERQISITLGTKQPPARVLILDDVISNGVTALLILGLLWTLSPTTETWLLAGLPSDWREILGWDWLDTHHPLVRATLFKSDANNGTITKEEQDRLVRPWPALLSGMVDEDDSTSLGWHSLSPHNLPQGPLTSALPFAAWQQAALTLRERITTDIHRRLSDQIPTEPIEPHGRALLQHGWPRRLNLNWEEWLWAFAWQQRSFTVADLAPICPVPPAQIEAALASYVQYHELQQHEQNGRLIFSIPPRLAILVYEPSLYEPDSELAAWLFEQNTGPATPFAVEYAYSNPHCAGAPTLAPVPEGFGAPVATQLWTFWPATVYDHAVGALHQWIINRTGDKTSGNHHQHEPKAPAGLVVGQLRDWAGIRELFYLYREPNLDFVLQTDLAPTLKAKRLAQLAVDSLTATTYPTDTDGIHYLAQALHNGIHTPLTPLYQRAILHLAGDAPDLATARHIIATRKGLPPSAPP